MKDTNKCLGALPCPLPRPLPGPFPGPLPSAWAGCTAEVRQQHRGRDVGAVRGADSGPRGYTGTPLGVWAVAVCTLARVTCVTSAAVKILKRSATTGSCACPALPHVPGPGRWPVLLPCDAAASPGLHDSTLPTEPGRTCVEGAGSRAWEWAGGCGSGRRAPWGSQAAVRDRCPQSSGFDTHVTFSFPLGMCAGVELLGHVVTGLFNRVRSRRLFHGSFATLHSLWHCSRVLVSPCPQLSSYSVLQMTRAFEITIQ